MRVCSSGSGFTVKVVVVLERDLAGMLVDFDHVGLRRIAVAVGGAVNVDAENRRQFAEQAAMDHQRVLVLPPDIDTFARDINLTGIAGREEKVASTCLRRGKVTEETPYVVLDAQRDFTPEKPLPKLRHSQIDEHIFRARLANRLPELLAVSRDDQGECAFDSACGLS